MTLRDLMESGIVFEGQIKVQSWEDETHPTVYYEGQESGEVTELDDEILCREVKYMFPYMFSLERVDVAGLCIEVEEGA